MIANFSNIIRSSSVVLMAASFFCCVSLSMAQEDGVDPDLITQDTIQPFQGGVSTGNNSMLDALELKDMDINDVLKLMAQKSGLNIIAGKSITGRVTIFLQNVDVRDAMTIILKANNLAYIEDKGVVQILTAAEYEQLIGHKFGVDTQRKVIRLDSLKAADAVTLLNQVKSPEGKVIADEQSNTVLMEDTAEKIAQVENYLKSIDLPTTTKVFKLGYTQAEALATKIQEMLTAKIGKVKFDASSNKLFITDTPKKIQEIEHIVSQIDVARDTQVFDISYAKAEDIVKSITPLLSKDVGHAEFDARSNSVIVTDILPKINQIKEVVAALDKTEKEVLIEAKIVQIDLSDNYKMGVDWQAIVRGYHDLTFDNKSDGFGLASTVTPKSVISIGTLDADDYTAALEMIRSIGKTKVLSSPSIAVVNNQEAKILVGTTKPYVTSTTTTPGTGPATTAETVNFIDVGVKLHVTPMIHDDGYITMKIKPEVSTAADSITTSQDNEIPIVNTSELETTVSVKDGVTIIMGGLIKDEVTDDHDKIPVLGDIPFLGKVFRRQNQSLSKTEIVIFLTPHIITGDAHVNPDQFTFDSNESLR